MLEGRKQGRKEEERREERREGEEGRKRVTASFPRITHEQEFAALFS